MKHTCDMFLLLFCTVFPGCKSGGPVEVNGIPVGADLRESADAAGVDYTEHLAKALQNETAALQELLNFSPRTDSTTATEHGSVLRAVLDKTGDDFFSKTVALVPVDVKQATWSVMEKQAPSQLKSAAPQTYKALLGNVVVGPHDGLYVFQNTGSTFRDCANSEQVFLAVDETDSLEKIYLRLLNKPYPGQAIFASMKGFTTPYYAGLTLPDNYAGFFVVTEAVKTETKNFLNNCVPYDFYALGTEPFWSAQVSETEGIVEFHGMDDERTRMFAFQPPVQEDSVKIYSAINQETGDNIKIVTQVQPCSDGMSDRTYPLHIKLTMNGKEYEGCGIPFADREKLDAQN